MRLGLARLGSTQLGAARLGSGWFGSGRTVPSLSLRVCLEMIFPKNLIEQKLKNILQDGAGRDLVRQDAAPEEANLAVPSTDTAFFEKMLGYVFRKKNRSGLKITPWDLENRIPCPKLYPY